MLNILRNVATLTALLALSASAADLPPAGQPRVALLIANVTYDDARLTLPPAVLVSTVHLYDVLKDAGFRIYGDAPLVNLTRDGLDEAFQGFAKTVPDHALVVIYYAGHGTERQTLNYLIPVDAKGERHSDIQLETLLRHFDQKDLTSIVILDACRSSQYPSAGMVQQSNLPLNALIAFPTQPGRFASPDTTYTDALVRHLREPIRIEAVFQKVRKEVQRITGFQTPQEYGSLLQTVYVMPPAGEPAEGQLMRSEAYYVYSDGQKRRIPDASSLEPLGFNPALSVSKSGGELEQIPDGAPYPGTDSNLLISGRCTYYLFWGMKWCLPQSPAADQLVPRALRKDGPIRTMLPGESAAIAGGDLARLPSGLFLRFEGSDGIYRSDAGALRSINPELAAPPLITTLPTFMRPVLRRLKGDSNQITGSRIVADPSRHQIFVTRRSTVLAYDLLGKGVLGAIDVKPGTPELMVLAETRGWLFVADSAQHVIHIIDAQSHRRLDDIPQSSAAPTLIRGLALSPDEERLYVANQGGETVATTGSISVFDLTRNHALASTIGKVNCPEGMTITPNGDQIYLASQCGGGNDPVFIVDTSTEEVTAIPGFPVGHNVAVSAPWHKAYVSRVDFPALDAAGNKIQVPAQVSVIDTSSRKLLGSWSADLHSFAVTPDGNYVLAIGGLRMLVIDAKTDRVINEMEFETPPAGVTVAPSNDGKDAMCYVWLPETPRLFFSGLGELEKASSH
jgi:DNA-binding beta-propeller fold protein YncE